MPVMASGCGAVSRVVCNEKGRERVSRDSLQDHGHGFQVGIILEKQKEKYPVPC